MEPTTEWTCEWCGKPCERKPTKGQRPKWCSPKCADAGRVARMAERTCPQCGESFKPCHSKVRFCSRDCAQGSRKKARQPTLPLDIDQRSAVRRAVEAADMEALRIALQSRSRLVGECWEWQGQLTSGAKKGGQYPLLRMGRNRRVQLHRTIAEIANGSPLGSQAAHHKSGNTKCVNPDHIQPVTHRDNIAEMLARAAFVARIAELEHALTEIAPNHPLLDRIPLAS